MKSTNTTILPYPVDRAKGNCMHRKQHVANNKENTLNTRSTSVVKAEVPLSQRLNKRNRFSFPKPDSRGAKVGCLENSIFVLNGHFPEVGGGTRSSMGKEKLNRIIESFGGAVSSTLTSKTSYLIVGHERKYSSSDLSLSRCYLYLYYTNNLT
jgi:NAD-dependent DNA ligase